MKKSRIKTKEREPLLPGNEYYAEKRNYNTMIAMLTKPKKKLGVYRLLHFMLGHEQEHSSLLMEKYFEDTTYIILLKKYLTQKVPRKPNVYLISFTEFEMWRLD